MADPNDRRKFTRIHFDGSTWLIQGTRRTTVELIDISLNGALVEANLAGKFRDEPSLTLLVSLSDDTEITMEVTPVHDQDRLLGLRCVNIDMDSMTHLRRLIELNLNEPMAAERVLDQLLQRSP